MQKIKDIEDEVRIIVWRSRSSSLGFRHIRVVLLLLRTSTSRATFVDDNQIPLQNRRVGLTRPVCADGKNSEEQGHVSTFGVTQGNYCNQPVTMQSLYSCLPVTV